MNLEATKPGWAKLPCKIPKAVHHMSSPYAYDMSDGQIDPDIEPFKSLLRLAKSAISHGDVCLCQSLLDPDGVYTWSFLLSREFYKSTTPIHPPSLHRPKVDYRLTTEAGLKQLDDYYCIPACFNFGLSEHHNHHRKEDFSLIIKDPATKETKATVGIHRALLEARVDYFYVLFNSGFADSKQKAAILYSDDVSPAAAEMIRSWCYCNAYSDFWSDIMPPVETVLDTAIAADYLRIPDLLKWCLHVFYVATDNFNKETMVPGCETLIPKLLTELYKRPQLNDFSKPLYNDAMSMLTQTSSLEKMWKLRVLQMPEIVLEDLVSRTIEIASREPSLSFDLAIGLVKLEGKTRGSKEKQKWDDMLLEPMFTALLPYLADNIDKIDWWENVLSFEFDKFNTTDVLLKLPDFAKPRNCKKMYELYHKLDTLMTSEDIMESNKEKVKEAKKKLVAWFGRNWLSMAVARPAFFGEWEYPSIESLAKELKVEIKDLVFMKPNQKPPGKPSAASSKRSSKDK
ncbi:hypothetical protein BZA77DRAFT_323797 [Pyronema omphalodes]|nr:hypothetical protein BZA77DRAFT_323797 [Pyronema omphalodes]